MRLLVLGSLLCVLAPTVALADCTPDQNVVFRCNTKNHKQISLCETKTTIVYAYGKKGLQPEIVLTLDRDKASTWQWQGMGRYETYSVDVPNGKTIYRVYSTLDHLSESHALDAGVQVEEGGKILATVACQEKGLINNLQGVDLQATP